MDNQNLSQNQGSNQLTNKPIAIKENRLAIIYLILAVFFQVLIIIYAFNVVAEKYNDMMFVIFWYYFVAFVLSVISSVFYLLFFRLKKINLLFTFVTFVVSLTIGYLSVNNFAYSYFNWRDSKTTKKIFQNLPNNIKITQKNTDQSIAIEENAAIFKLTNQYYSYNYKTGELKEINLLNNNDILFSSDKRYFSLKSNSEPNVLKLYKNGNDKYWEIRLSDVGNVETKVFSEDSQFFIFSISVTKEEGIVFPGRIGYGILNLQSGQVEYVDVKTMENKVQELWHSYTNCSLGDIGGKFYDQTTLNCPKYQGQDDIIKHSYTYNGEIWGSPYHTNYVINENQEWLYILLESVPETTTTSNEKQIAIFKINLKTNEQNIIFGPVKINDGNIEDNLVLVKDNLFFNFNAKGSKNSSRVYRYNSQSGLQEVINLDSISHFELIAK